MPVSRQSHNTHECDLCERKESAKECILGAENSEMNHQGHAAPAGDQDITRNLLQKRFRANRVPSRRCESECRSEISSVRHEVGFNAAPDASRLSAQAPIGFSATKAKSKGRCGNYCRHASEFFQPVCTICNDGRESIFSWVFAKKTVVALGQTCKDGVGHFTALVAYPDNACKLVEER